MLIFTPHLHFAPKYTLKLMGHGAILCNMQGRLVLRGAMHTWGPGYFRFHDPQAGTSYAVHFRVSISCEGQWLVYVDRRGLWALG